MLSATPMPNLTKQCDFSDGTPDCIARDAHAKQSLVRDDHPRVISQPFEFDHSSKEDCRSARYIAQIERLSTCVTAAALGSAIFAE